MEGALNDTGDVTLLEQQQQQQQQQQKQIGYVQHQLHQPSIPLVQDLNHDSIPGQVLAAAELLLQRSRDAAALSPWWLHASPETVTYQIDTYRKAIRSVQNQLSTLPDMSTLHQLHHTQQPSRGRDGVNGVLTAASLKGAAALQNTARQRTNTETHNSVQGQQEAAEARDAEADLLLRGDRGISSNSENRTSPDPDLNPDTIQDIQQIPLHSIPIHANVTTYDWGPLIQSSQFDVIMMDPPWQLATANPTRGVALGYSQLNDEAIASLPIPELQQNGFLFVWVINAKYKWTLDLFERWGYELVDEVVWVKMTVNRRLAKSHGYYLQHAKEVCLVGKRGYDPPGTSPTGVASDIIFSERRGQSQKPTEIYDLIEALVPNGRYLEIFARRNNLRDHWTSIGNEVTGTGLPPEDLASLAEHRRIAGAVYGRGTTS